MRLSEAAGHLEGRLVRDGVFESLGKANHKKHAMLVFVEDSKNLTKTIKNSNVSCVVTTPELQQDVPEALGLALAVHPRLAFYKLHEYLDAETEFYWTPFDSVVDPTAHVHPMAYIAPRNVRIGARTMIEPGACVHERTIVGDDCVIRSGAILGGAGFEFRSVHGTVMPITHTGGLRIGDRVAINHGTVVDRAVYGDWSSIGDDTKIDSSTQIAHNVQIGQRCIVGAVVAISGNTIIEDDVRMGPGAVISNGLRVGAGCWITLGSVVVRDVEPGTKVSGNFAIDHERFRRFMARMRSSDSPEIVTRPSR